MNIKTLFSGAVFFASLGLSYTANAIVIDIHCTADEYNAPGSTCSGYEGTTADGTLFVANPSPTLPSTGTGVFEPFVRLQAKDTQSGYNTDYANSGGVNYDTKTGTWTHSVLFGDLGTVDILGQSYFHFSLDANESDNKDNIFIDITEIKIFIGGSDLKTPENHSDSDPTDGTLAGYSSVWNLDNATNGDVTINLSADICETSGNCGSGKGDLSMLLPTNLFTGFNDDDYFVFYSEYVKSGGGFEEWNYRADASAVPAPAPIALLGAGLLALGAIHRRTRS